MKSQSGIALIIVLWSMMLLSVVAASLSYAMRHEVRVVDNTLQSVKASNLLDAGIYLGIQELLSQHESETGQPYFETEYAIDKTVVKVKLADEHGKVDINFVPRELILSLLMQSYSSACLRRTECSTTFSLNNPASDCCPTLTVTRKAVVEDTTSSAC